MIDARLLLGKYSIPSEKILLDYARADGYTHMRLCHSDGVSVTFCKRVSVTEWFEVTFVQDFCQDSFSRIKITRRILEPDRVRFHMIECPWMP